MYTETAPTPVREYISTRMRCSRSSLRRFFPTFAGEDVHFFALFLTITLGLQLFNNAFIREFDSNDDEAAHFMTGLRIRDYALELKVQNPMAYAERYYLSYPKVAFGIWPPLFHFVESAWTMVLPPARWSVMLLMTLLSSSCAFLVYRFASRLGRTIGLLAALFFLANPVLWACVGFVNMDLMVALLCFASAWYFGAFLESGDWRDSVRFGIIASAAILTKYNALCLALLPLFALLLTRRIRLLKDWKFWLPLPIVTLFAGPWYAFNWGRVLYAAEPWPSASERWHLLLINTYAVLRSAGIPLTIFAVAGVTLVLLGKAPGKKWVTSMTALLLSLCTFHCVFYPIFEQRYFLTCVPALVMLATPWFWWILHRRNFSRTLLVAATALLTLVLLPSMNSGTPKGYRETASQAQALLNGKEGTVLVSFGASGEGAFVAEMALQEKRPASYVLRASKMLANSTWMGINYVSRVQSASDVEELLDELRVSLVVVGDDAAHSRPHHQWLLRALHAPSSSWRQVAGKSPLSMYHRTEPFKRPPQEVSIDLSLSLGRSLQSRRLSGNESY
ncbi:MAG TPA: glycosyltransferase family 39 protein [Bryobacteraceae bacterium]|nr:glycosyltransferase family 39 protein [Bryobacteraceae bacterium]